MLKKASIIGFLFPLCLLGQNLASNGNFVNISGIHNSVAIFRNIDYWIGWKPHYGKNGTYNWHSGGIADNPLYGIYAAGIGLNPIQYSGKGYMSITFYVNQMNEYHLGTGGGTPMCNFSIHKNNLTSILQKDTTYCVEMHVRVWGGFLTGYWHCHTHDKLGVYFTDQDSLPSASPWRDGIVPQVWNNTGYIDNTDHWRPVRGSFVASGGEQYMYIGNFAPYSSPPLQFQTSPDGRPCNTADRSFVLIDAVMVYNCRDTVFNITLQDTTVCHGTTVTLAPLVAGFKLEDTVRTYTWHTPMGTFTNADTFFVATQPGTYTLEVMTNKRFKATQTITVKWMAPEPEPRLLPEGPLPWCRDQRLPLHAPYIDSAQYRWNNGSTDTLTYYDWPGTYTVDITHPCWQYTESVEVEPRNCYDIWIPNAFTPDGDGTNDFFEIRGLHEENGLPITLYITDRWGKVVFQSNDYKNTWDGTYNGQPLQAGVYTYRVIYNKVKGGINYEEYGTVQIVR